MKKYLFVVALFGLFLCGCKKDNPVVPPSPNNQSGNLFLKIDRENTPAGVVSLTAYLTRQGFTSLSGTMNLLTDTTATISFNQLPVGDWHLRITAQNQAGVILYTGETTVTVQANFITQVNLTLIPTGNGYGSINILVTWGTTPSSQQWIDFNANPVLSKINNFYDQNGISHPIILYENNNYKMWFNNMAADNKSYTFYATSPDGINWTRVGTFPTLFPGIGDAWDNGSVTTFCVLKLDTGYKLYYSGLSTVTGKRQIGVATSLNGINWEKNSTPILSGSSSGWDFLISGGEVVMVNGVYYLYYSASSNSYSEYKIGVATSTDGINFTKFNGNPIIAKTQSWESEGVMNPSVIYDDGMFKMVYMNRHGVNMSLGMATSSDGKNWTKSTSNPIFGCPNTFNGWASAYVSYPCFRKTGNEYRIYYSGSNIFDQKTGKIGFVKKSI